MLRIDKGNVRPYCLRSWSFLDIYRVLISSNAFGMLPNLISTADVERLWGRAFMFGFKGLCSGGMYVVIGSAIRFCKVFSL